ncbi:Co2+/Mg2+ efflux protein ApaG [Sphingobium yanoikuyae]|uniref:Protein ApaG n=1 Tax=Sphingobium yanoikuyae TaxID=13690 RepID=A0A6M4G687_SPHYA|nr:Co2+/Mg2+ efflux protein ApaG [Sphingobium yanoikuyae]QJR02629.1 Co2+/Mg2+ efflux protein ApaG [Sphingobium yanoikuyae]
MNALFPLHATTRDIIVHVAVTFLPEQSEPDRGRWFWAYHIRIENQGEQPVQLLSRHWIITDGRGIQQELEGEGVIGEQPVVQPGKSYDYVSGYPLNTATGSMRGAYTMIGSDGETFEVTIPHFALIAPAVAE